LAVEQQQQAVFFLINAFQKVPLQTYMTDRIFNLKNKHYLSFTDYYFSRQLLLDF